MLVYHRCTCPGIVVVVVAVYSHVFGEMRDFDIVIRFEA